VLTHEDDPYKVKSKFLKVWNKHRMGSWCIMI
jgi:hypothetical protein